MSSKEESQNLTKGPFSFLCFKWFYLNSESQNFFMGKALIEKWASFLTKVKFWWNSWRLDRRWNLPQTRRDVIGPKFHDYQKCEIRNNEEMRKFRVGLSEEIGLSKWRVCRSDRFVDMTLLSIWLVCSFSEMLKTDSNSSQLNQLWIIEIYCAVSWL